MNNIDEKALKAATEIMQLLTPPMPESQLKAKIQCVIVKLLESSANAKN